MPKFIPVSQIYIEIFDSYIQIQSKHVRPLINISDMNICQSDPRYIFMLKFYIYNLIIETLIKNNYNLKKH